MSDARKLNPYIEQGLIGAYYYYAHEEIVNCAQEGLGDCIRYTFKLHLNIEEKSYHSNRKEIIDAIGRAAVEAKIGGDDLCMIKMVCEKIYAELKVDQRVAEFWLKIKSANLADVRALFNTLRAGVNDCINFDEIDFSTPAELHKLADKKFNEAQLEIALKKRFLDKGQVTCYITGDESDSDRMSKVLCHFIAALEAEFKKLTLVASKEINDTDSPLTEFVSFRLEKLDSKEVPRFALDEKQFFIFKPEENKVLKLKQEKSALYAKLVAECKKRNIFCLKKSEPKVIGYYDDAHQQWESIGERQMRQVGVKIKKPR